MARIPGTTKRRQGEIRVGLPVIDDDWDEDTKNAHALRNATWIDGQCPSCGAEVTSDDARPTGFPVGERRRATS